MGLCHYSGARRCFLLLDQRLSEAIVSTMGGVMVSKLLVVMEIHTGEVPVLVVVFRKVTFIQN